MHRESEFEFLQNNTSFQVDTAAVSQDDWNIPNIDEINVFVQDSPPTRRNRIEKKAERRYRTVFTSTQLSTLETTFTTNPYISETQRVELAEKLELSEIRVKTWFQNRRTKAKRERVTGRTTPDTSIKNLISGQLETSSMTSESSVNSNFGIQRISDDSCVPNGYYNTNSISNYGEQHNADFSSTFASCSDYSSNNNNEPYTDLYTNTVCSNFGSDTSYNQPMLSSTYGNPTNPFDDTYTGHYVGPMSTIENAVLNQVVDHGLS